MRKIYRWFFNFMSGDALDEIDRLQTQLKVARADADEALRQRDEEIKYKNICATQRNETWTERVEVFRRCVHLEQVNEDLQNKLIHLQRIESLERKRKHLPDSALAGVTLGLVSTTCEGPKKS
jgi:Na+/phosphate symporter